MNVNKKYLAEININLEETNEGEGELEEIHDILLQQEIEMAVLRAYSYGTDNIVGSIIVKKII